MSQAPRYTASHDAPMVWSIHDNAARPPKMVALLDWRDDDRDDAAAELQRMAAHVAAYLSGALNHLTPI